MKPESPKQRTWLEFLAYFVYEDPFVMWVLYIGMAISAAIPECPAWITQALIAWKAVRSIRKKQQEKQNNEETTKDTDGTATGGDLPAGGLRDTTEGR